MEAEKRSQTMGNKSTLASSQPAGAKRGDWILRGQLYKK